MLEELFHLPENSDEPLPLEEWFYELISCPSQCYYHLQHQGTHYVLYLRWRWEDPWQGHVIKNASTLDKWNEENAVWSEDIFEAHNIHFKEEEVELAKAKIISMFYKSDGNFPERERVHHQPK